MKKSRDKPTEAGAVELSEDELGQAKGGYEVTMKDCLVTSYQSGGSAAPDAPNPDATLTSSTPKR